MVQTPSVGQHVSIQRSGNNRLKERPNKFGQTYQSSACPANVMQNHLVLVYLLPHPLRKNRRRSSSSSSSSHHCMSRIHGRMGPHERLLLGITRRETIDHCMSRIQEGTPGHDRSWLSIHSRGSGHHCVGRDHGGPAGIDRSRKA